MSRWDDKDFHEFEFENKYEVEEESRLLEKFNDYLDLEKSEKERRKALEGGKSDFPKQSKIHSVISYVLGGTVLTGITAAFLFLWGFR